MVNINIFKIMKVKFFKIKPVIQVSAFFRYFVHNFFIFWSKKSFFFLKLEIWQIFFNLNLLTFGFAKKVQIEFRRNLIGIQHPSLAWNKAIYELWEKFLETGDLNWKKKSHFNWVRTELKIEQVLADFSIGRRNAI